MVIAVVVVCAFFALTCLYLYSDREDLRWRLKMSEGDARRWREEAIKRGWKNPFEEVAASLEASNAVLKAVADSMRQTAELQKKNTEAVQRINEALKRANGNMRSQLEHLERARRYMEAASRGLRPAASQARSDDTPQDRMLRQAMHRVETDVITGQAEKDPRKLN
jgi:hypothetical protein